MEEMNQHLPHKEQQQEEVEKVGPSRRRVLEPLVVSRPPPGPQAGESGTWGQTFRPPVGGQEEESVAWQRGQSEQEVLKSPGWLKLLSGLK